MSSAIAKLTPSASRLPVWVATVDVSFVQTLPMAGPANCIVGLRNGTTFHVDEKAPDILRMIGWLDAD